MAVRIGVHLLHRDRPIMFNVEGFTAREINEQWSAAYAQKRGTFNMTDTEGREISIVIPMVTFLAVVDIKESE